MPVLSETQRNELIAQSTKISEIYDHYQDIEWAYDMQGRLYLLQSRPITTIPSGYERVFDNSNIIESYPGVVSPMTFSILHLDYYHCIKDALIRFGVSKRTVGKRDDVLKNLVGYVNGHTYYNISNWYRTILITPFFKKKIIDYFEQMIGTEGSFVDDLDDAAMSRFEQLVLSFNFPFKFTANLVKHDRLVKDYFCITTEIGREFKALDLDALSSDELVGYLVHFSKRFMKALSIPILNDFYAMIFMAVTREQFKKSSIPDAENLLNSMLSHQHIESTKPVISLAAMADMVRDNENLSTCLNDILLDAATDDTTVIVRRLNKGGFIDFSTKFEIHVDLYGHRSPKELIMEADTFRENPHQLIRFILDSSSIPKREMPEKGGVAAEKIEAQLKKENNGWLLKWLLNKTRNAIAYREATRLDRGLHFSYFRTLLNTIGKKLVEEGVLDLEKDIFHITLQELDDFRKGRSPNGDLRGLIHYRKIQQENWVTKKQEGKLFTRGTVYANEIPEVAPLDSAEKNVLSLKGMGCSDGIVSAVARTVTNPSETQDVKGKILVSETTDPGWVFLMTISSGLISERGSLLSHTAIIGRELGIPTIVGVKDATKRIVDGSKIIMNGKTGEIELSPTDVATKKGDCHDEKCYREVS